jgi:hypothetical protein
MVEKLMTITRTRGTVRAKRPRIAAEPVQDQLNLGVPFLSENSMDSQMVIHDSSSPADVAIGRAFVPSNRELLLRQLSALVLSPNFPLAAGIPVDPSQRVLVIDDGLRIDEIDILADGRPQRFPVLAEIRGTAVQSGAGAFGIGDVVALHFRNEDEATNFRFRPVDELDTAYIPCLTAPSMFGLDGDARFSSEETVPPAQDGSNAAVADRIGGAVCCLLQLSQAEPRCREAIADLLSRRSSVPWLMALAHHSMAGPENDSAGACAAIVRGFIEHEEGSPSHLVQELGHYLGELADPEVKRAVPRWLQMADAVLGNRIVLDGDVLSDNGSIALRAAILAVVVDDVKDLVAFIRAERPAGMQVIVGAAFLIGMRTGVADLPWQWKLPHLNLLSPLLVALHQSEPAARQEALDAFQAEPDESASPLQLLLYWRDMEILRWVPRSEPDNVASVSDAADVTIDAEVPSCQESSLEQYDHDRNRAITGPEGRVIEILASSDTTEMTSLRLLLKETDRLRKAKEIMEASCTQAVFWRVGVTGEGIGALYLDIAGRPSDALLEVMNLKLAEALSLYLVPAKPKRRAKATTASKRGVVTAAS